MFNSDANTQAIIGYKRRHDVSRTTSNKGRQGDLTGQKGCSIPLESGDKFLDIFNSPPTKFSKIPDHLAKHHYPGAADQETAAGWLVKEGLMF